MPATLIGSRKGAVLVMVLWILLAISMLALSFSVAIRTEVDAARNMIDQKQAYFMARAGIEYAVYKIFESNSAFAQAELQQMQPGFAAIPQVMTGLVTLELADGGADIEVIDESGKINLNLAPDHLIYNLMITVGMDPQSAEEVTASILDWRDPDDMYRGSGAENNYYQSLDQPYLAKNGPFDVPEELLLVRGVTPEIYYGRKGLNPDGQRVEYFGLQNYFTTFGNLNRINVNSAPVPVLAAIPGVEYDVALQIATLRQQMPIQDIAEVTSLIPGLPGEVLSYLSPMRSNVYTLVSNGYRNGTDVVSRVRAVVRVMGTSNYAVLYWNESNIEL